MPASANFVLVCTPYLTPDDLEKERVHLSRLLATPEMKERFYQSIELVNRNHITTNRSVIKDELSRRPMRSFRFVINKN